MAADCIFCKILAGEIPCFKVYEDSDTLAFMDINPVHPGHALVIPREHAANVFEVSDEAIAATAKTARRVAKAVRAVLEPDGMNLLQCNGKAAAQSVEHFHMHVLPRATNDGASLNWDLNPGNMDEIKSVADRVAAAME